MENLTRRIDTAIASNDYVTIQSIFCSSGNSNTTNETTWLSLGQGEQRSLAAYFIVAVVVKHETFLQSSMSTLYDTYSKVLQHLPSTVEHAADNTLRNILFQFLVSEQEDYSGAAKILSSMRMSHNTTSNDNNDPDGIYQMTPADKTDVYVKIAECYLLMDEIMDADAAVQKAGIYVEQISNKEECMSLILRYKSTYARILDANRKFISAATRYHELSQSSTEVIDADDLLQLLGRAVTCAILAPSGPQRQRVISSIVNDIRLSSLDSISDFTTHGTILKKMYTHQIIRPNELIQFETSLSDHQKAIMGDGMTIMDRAIVEHNMIAVSDIYESIYISELAWILGVAANKAESISANMIMDGSIHASIDQVNNLLIFTNENEEQQPIETYDRLVNNFCIELNNIVTSIKTNPKFTENQYKEKLTIV